MLIFVCLLICLVNNKYGLVHLCIKIILIYAQLIAKTKVSIAYIFTALLLYVTLNFTSDPFHLAFISIV